MGEGAGGRGRVRALGLGARDDAAATLPNYEMPGFDGIGANEFIVDVTHPDAVDFISAGRHAAHLGAEHLVSHAECRLPDADQRRDGFPCIYRRSVGLGAIYAKLDGALTYRKWIDAVQAGRNYVSDGKSHLMDFTVNGVEAGRIRERDSAGSAGSREGHGRGGRDSRCRHRTI